MGSPQLWKYGFAAIRFLFHTPRSMVTSPVFPSAFEEMIFRGLLQRRSVQRYGTYRGIFFVGIVWAAFHFSSDFAFARVTDQETILKLASRIFTCLAPSYVLGWL